MNNSGIVIITGASSGIGAEISREFHKRGHTVMLVARREDRLLALQRELEVQRPNSVLIRVCDLTKRSEVQVFAKELEAQTVIGLVNNAGIGSLGSFSSLDLSSELAQIELNVLTPLILTHAVVSGMRVRKTGFIINVSSIFAYQAVPFVATYAATKAFEWRHSVALQRELSEYGIRVLTLCPGPTETEFFGVAKVPGGMWNFKRAPAKLVAQTCLRDLDAGKTVSIPTLTAKALVLLAQISPTFIYTWVIKKVLTPVLARHS